MQNARQEQERSSPTIESRHWTSWNFLRRARDGRRDEFKLMICILYRFEYEFISDPWYNLQCYFILILFCYSTQLLRRAMDRVSPSAVPLPSHCLFECVTSVSKQGHARKRYGRVYRVPQQLPLPSVILRQRFNNGHMTLWQSLPFFHACILWTLLQYRATLQTLHFSMIASFAQVCRHHWQ